MFSSRMPRKSLMTLLKGEADCAKDAWPGGLDGGTRRWADAVQCGVGWNVLKIMGLFTRT